MSTSPKDISPDAAKCMEHFEALRTPYLHAFSEAFSPPNLDMLDGILRRRIERGGREAFGRMAGMAHPYCERLGEDKNNPLSAQFRQSAQEIENACDALGLDIEDETEKAKVACRKAAERRPAPRRHEI